MQISEVVFLGLLIFPFSGGSLLCSSNLDTGWFKGCSELDVKKFGSMFFDGSEQLLNGHILVGSTIETDIREPLCCYNHNIRKLIFLSKHLWLPRHIYLNISVSILLHA